MLVVMRRLFVLVSICATSALLGCDSPGSLTPDEYLSRAREHLLKGDLAAALLEAKNAVQAGPEHAEARHLLGEIYLSAGEGPAAEKELQRAVRLGVADSTVKLGITRALLLQGKYDELIQAAVDDAATGAGDAESLSAPDRATVMAMRGHAFLARGKTETGSSQYAGALALDPENVEAAYGLALMSVVTGDLEDARTRLDALFKKAPGHAPSWSLLGELERAQGHAEAAEAAYTRAIESRLNNVFDLTGRALTRIYLAKYDEARRDAAEVERRAPRSPVPPYLRGLIAFQQGQPTALESFQEALKRDPDYMPAEFYGALAAARQGRFEQAESGLVRYLAAYPASNEAAKALAGVRMRRGDFSGAYALLQGLVSRAPDDPQVLELIGTAALATGSPVEATAYLQKVTAQSADSSRAYMKLGLSHLAQGKRDAAVSALSRAQAQNPVYETPAVLLVLTHIQARDYAAAAEAARVLAEQSPDSPIGPDLLGLTRLAQGDESGAREAFEGALTRSPTDLTATEHLAQLDLRAGDAERARSRYRAVLAREAGNAGALLGLAVLEIRENNLDSALSLLEESVRRQPEATASRVLLSRLYRRAGKNREALNVLQQAGARAEQDPALLLERARTEAASGQVNSAAETYDRLVDLVPTSPDIHYEAAEVFAQTGDLSRSRKHVDRVLAVEPKHLKGRIVKARILVAEGKLAEAKLLVSGLHGEHPDNPDVLALEGWVAGREKRYTESATAYEKAFAAVPDRGLALSLAAAQVQAGQPDAGIATLTAWVGRHPDDVGMQASLANFYLTLGRRAEARSAYEALVKRDPKNVMALHNLVHLVRAEDPTRALDLAARAAQLAPTNWQVLDTYGLVLMDRGEVPKAVVVLRDAVNLQPGVASLRYHLAVAMARSGDAAGAKTVLRPVIESKAVFPERSEAEAFLMQLDG